MKRTDTKSSVYRYFSTVNILILPCFCYSFLLYIYKTKDLTHGNYIRHTHTKTENGFQWRLTNNLASSSIDENILVRNGTLYNHTLSYQYFILLVETQKDIDCQGQGSYANTLQLHIYFCHLTIA